MNLFLKGLETFAIGVGVVIVSSVIQALSNYHPTGQEGALWAIVGVAIIGGFRALLSWLIIKQSTTVQTTTSQTTTTVTTPPPTGVKP